MPQPKRPLRRIACLGEAMIEMIVGDGARAAIGVAGDTYNTAVYLARAAGAGEVSYVTALGPDRYSVRILSAIRSGGICTDLVERRDGPLPGLYAIETDDRGERSFSYWRSESAARTLFTPPCKVSPGSLDRFDLVYLSGISMAILPDGVRGSIMDWADGFRAGGGTIAYDSNHRPRLWEDSATARRVNESMWSRTDIALPSVDDETSLHGDADASAVLRRLRGLGAVRGALKCGAEGPVDIATGEVPEGLERAARVVDSTGAGDGFNAAYLAAIAAGGTDMEAAKAERQPPDRQHPRR